MPLPSRRKGMPRFTRGREPAPQARLDDPDRTMRDIDPLVRKAVHRFADGDMNYMTRARVLARRALDTYDPARGASVATHVYNNLKRLHRIKGERAAVQHTPERVRMAAGKLTELELRCADEKGRPPTADEIAEELNISRKHVERLRRMARGELSESAVTSDKGDYGVEAAADDGDGPAYADVWADYVYHDSDPMDKLIMEGLTGYAGAAPATRKQLAERLNASRATLSRRSAKLLKRLGDRPRGLA